MGKRIAVLGASYLQLPLVEKAKNRNIEVHCFAWDKGNIECKYLADYFYPISVLEKEEIFIKCREIGVDGILTIATDICIPTISYIANRLDLIANSEECASLTTNKGIMRSYMERHNLPTPKNKVISSVDDFKNIDFKFPLIVKPVDRSGSIGVSKVMTEKELKQAVGEALTVSFKKKCIVEEFIEGCEVSVETISYKGKHKVLAITDKVVTPSPYFVEIEHHQPSKISEKIIESIIRNTFKILDCFKVQYGASHLEYRITREGEIYLIEIGSRMGGDFIGSDLVELSTGVDYVNAVINIAFGDFTWDMVEIKETSFSGVYFLSKETRRLLQYFNKEQVIKSIVKKQIINSDLKNIKSSNDRSGYLIYKGKDKLIL